MSHDKGYFEKEFDDHVYEDDYYSENYDEELADDDEEDEDEDGYDAKSKGKKDDDEDKDEDDDDEDSGRRIHLIFACDDCDYRWDDHVPSFGHNLSEGDDFDDVACPMCGSVNVEQL